jgi:hypothetical protein
MSQPVMSTGADTPPQRPANTGCRSLGRVSRPQPYAPRPWLLRGLLVLLTLTGLDIWQGEHCIDGTSAHHATSTAAVSAGSATTTATAGLEISAAPAMSAHHGDVAASGPSNTTADNCYIAPPLGTRTTMMAIPVLPAVERAASVASSSRTSTPRCFAPGVALTRLGVSRT